MSRCWSKKNWPPPLDGEGWGEVITRRSCRSDSARFFKCLSLISINFIVTLMNTNISSIPTSSLSTSDLCDVHKADTSGDFRVLPPIFPSFGGHAKFSGVVSTVKCFEDNTSVKQALDEPGAGRVLVVDGAASMRRALVGGNIAAAAAKNGWAGVLINGCVRDAAELEASPLGIRALALIPMPTLRRAAGERDVAVQIQGVWVRPGDWLCADLDGIVVSAHPPA